MRELSCLIADGLWDALHTRSRETGEPIRHIVATALADHLGAPHRTLFQVSTSSALVEGVYQGAVTVGVLREHGDLGLGTFEELDGEMIVVDGHCFQVRGDGSVHAVADDILTPFAAVARFEPNATETLAECPDLAALEAVFDRLRTSDNVYYALRVDGRFDHIHTRAMCRTHEGVPLAQAAATQPEFDFKDISGTLVGFWSPPFSKSFSVPGYHLHFISSDRKHGGHLLACTGLGLKIALQTEASLQVALPETEDFLRADLTRDPNDALRYAEREHGR